MTTRKPTSMRYAEWLATFKAAQDALHPVEEQKMNELRAAQESGDRVVERKKEIIARYEGDLNALTDRMLDALWIVERRYCLGIVDRPGDPLDMYTWISPGSFGTPLWLHVGNLGGLDANAVFHYLTPEMIRRVAVIREILDDYIAGKRDDLPTREPWL
jgi:hypothetical protein